MKQLADLKCNNFYLLFFCLFSLAILFFFFCKFKRLDLISVVLVIFFSQRILDYCCKVYIEIGIGMVISFVRSLSCIFFTTLFGPDKSYV